MHKVNTVPKTPRRKRDPRRTIPAVSSADNVLVHFVGWAIVFDMYREDGRVEWDAWRTKVRARMAVEEARVRLDRTTSERTVAAWMERLSDERREVRLATAKGLWKLRSATVVDRGRPNGRWSTAAGTRRHTPTSPGCRVGARSRPQG